MEELNAIMEKFKNEQGTIIGLLQDILEAYGYLPEEQLRIVSTELGVPLSQLFSLATFYNGFRLEPMGKHHICACVGTACHVKGATGILDTLERELGIHDGETTEDRNFTLDTVNCLGACALAPLVTMNREYYGRMTQKRIKSLLKQLKEKDEG